MRHINHITLNTGHARKTLPNEVNKSIYFILRRMRKEIFSSSGTEIIDGYTAKGTEEKGNGALITVYDRHSVPVITIGIAKHNHSTIWKLLHQTTTMPLQTDPTSPPEAPYVADRLEIGALMNMEAMSWTGDFSRCMAWMYLFPNEIR
ncbi:hypothetical protein QT236_14435 [Geobacillus stearothermophilus]|nr:hypothetical protein QT236_14435 [Geobacillus stearothermophilus]